MLNRKLIYAAADGELKTIRELLNQGAEINYQDQDGYTALIMASSRGYLEIIRELLNRGAEIHHQEERGYTALYFSIRNGHHQVTRLLEKRTNEQIKEQKTNLGRKEEMKLFFLGGKEKTFLSFFKLGKEKEVKPMAYIPKEIVNIIDSYLRQDDIPEPTRKIKS